MIKSKAGIILMIVGLFVLLIVLNLIFAVVNLGSGPFSVLGGDSSCETPVEIGGVAVSSYDDFRRSVGVQSTDAELKAVGLEEQNGKLIDTKCPQELSSP